MLRAAAGVLRAAGVLWAAGVLRAATATATAAATSPGHGRRFQEDERKDNRHRCQILESHDLLLRTSWFFVIAGG
jgi:hypothetical protein